MPAQASIAVVGPGGSSDDAGEAFAALYERYRHRAYRFALGQCREVALAEEAVHEAFLRLYQPWLAGRVRDFWPYLRRAVANEVYGVYRRRRVERRATAAATAAAVPAAVVRHEDTTADGLALLGALDCLTARQRAVVVLRFYEDLSQEQTAAVLGISVGTVKTQSSRAVARLRSILRRDPGPGPADSSRPRAPGRVGDPPPGR